AEPARGAVFSQDGRRLLMVSPHGDPKAKPPSPQVTASGHVCVWDAQTGLPRGEVRTDNKAKDEGILAARLGPTGGPLIAVIKPWRQVGPPPLVNKFPGAVTIDQRKFLLRRAGPDLPDVQLSDYAGEMAVVLFSPDGKHLAGASHVLDART